MSPAKKSPRKSRTPDNLSSAAEAKPQELFNQKSAATYTLPGNASNQSGIINSAQVLESSHIEALKNAEKESEHTTTSTNE